MTPEAIKTSLLSNDLSPDDIFMVTRAVAYHFQRMDTAREESIDLIIRLIDRRHLFEKRLSGVSRMIDAIAREAGLYPYVERADRWHDELAMEIMKAPGLDGVTFHIEQALVFGKLAYGKSVILSAPTSFGKSLLIDALIALRKPKTVVAVVPTIALLDEFRRRMSRRFPEYDVITTASETARDIHTIFVGTQERLLERADIPNVDLFVIDEFYKLDLERNDNRSLALNAILAKYGTKAKQIYFLGPSIDDVPNANRFRADLEFVRTRYSPVTADIIDRTDSPPTPERLIGDLQTVRGESSLVYVRSPRAAWTLAERLIEEDVGSPSSFCEDFGEWLGSEFHPEWTLANSVSRGFGLHHGRVPRAVAYLMISLFNKRELSTILCTSSMIEGVNTAAENVLIYDRHISTTKLDRFTFDNIKGRAGRLFQHKIGKIFLYNPPPETAQFEVRVPLFETDDRLVPELLVQLDDAALTPFARQRKRAITDASELPPETLRRWAEFSVEGLSKLADSLISEIGKEDSLLLWKGVPDFNQVEACFEIVWSTLKFHKHDMRSARQTAFFASALRNAGAIRPFINRFVKETGLAAQPDIDRCFNFLRGAEYTFPQVLRALNDVIDALVGEGMVDYRVYAQQLQNLFMPSGLRTLDEFGVPIPLAQKLKLGDAEDTFGTVREISIENSQSRNALSPFEIDLLNRGLSLEG